MEHDKTCIELEYKLHVLYIDCISSGLDIGEANFHRDEPENERKQLLQFEIKRLQKKYMDFQYDNYITQIVGTTAFLIKHLGLEKLVVEELKKTWEKVLEKELHKNSPHEVNKN